MGSSCSVVPCFGKMFSLKADDQLPHQCNGSEACSSLGVGGGIFMNICKAGVKIRMVPNTETVRKAQRKILSNTWATNFQSCTTCEKAKIRHGITERVCTI